MARNFKFITGKTMAEWRLNAADGTRRIEWRKNRLWTVLMDAPVVGQVLERPVTDAELADYRRIRRHQKLMAQHAKDAAAKAEQAESEYTARHAKRVAEKAARIAAEQERRELREIRNELKKLEAAEPAKVAVEQAAPTEKEQAISTITARIPVLRSYIYAVQEQIDTLREERNSLRGEESFCKKFWRELEWDWQELLGNDPADLAEELGGRAEAAYWRLWDIDVELADLREKKADAIAEIQGLNAALKAIMANRVDAPFAIALADKVREARPTEPDVTIRIATKVPEKASTPSYKARVAKAKVLYKDLKAERDVIVAYKPEFDEDMAVGYGYTFEALTKESLERLLEVRAAKDALVKKLAALMNVPFKVTFKETTVVHLPETMMTKVFGIKCGSSDICNDILVADHKTEDFFKANWLVWGDTPDEAEANYAEFVELLYERLDKQGVILGKKHFTNYGASASKLKQEKVDMADDELLKKHEDVRFFDKTEAQFAAENPIVGPELWKAWANIGRPWSCDLLYEDGTVADPKDILVAPAPKYIYHHEKAIKIGELYDELGSAATENGKPYWIGPVTHEVELFAGQILFWKKLQGQGGQLNGYGLKGFAAYIGGSVLDEFLKKNHLTRAEFMDCKIRNIDGELVRIGDYKAIATDDIWKFSKFFRTYKDYLDTIDRLSKKYPVVSTLGLLRQSEDEEGQWKRRHATRSLFQQFFNWTAEEVTKLVKPSAKKIAALMKYENAIKKLAGLTRDMADRTPIEQLFGVAPWLFAAPGVQKYWKAKLRFMTRELMGNRLDAKGQYPYILQDPIAMLEIMVLGTNPKDAGIVPAGFISLSELPDGAKVLALRFPANFLTARTKVNMALKEVFKDLNNVCVLSIHDTILIIQDGDVDGDEMCILYDKLVVELVDRMVEEIDPPVVIFAHGSKAKATVCGAVDALREKMAHARYMASHNDHTGIYADLARNCAMLAAVAYKNDDAELFAKYLVWMAAASTGAIISIDQVKGNDVSKVLENWLADIQKAVGKAMNRKKPYTQQFLKDVAGKDCNAPWEACLPDAIAVEVKQQVGPFMIDSPLKTWSEMKDAATAACFNHNVGTVTVQAHALSDAAKTFLNTSLYAEPTYVDKTGKVVDVDKEFRENAINGEVWLSWYIDYLYHNCAAISATCEGAMLYEKQQEYYKLCWIALKEFATTDKKPSNSTTPKTANTLVNGLYATLVNMALKLTRGKDGEGDDPDGSKCWFILNVIAAPLAATIRKNGWKQEDFVSPVQPETEKELDNAVAEHVELWGEDEMEFSNFKEAFGFSDKEFEELQNTDFDWIEGTLG